MAPPLAPLAWLRWDVVGRYVREIEPTKTIEIGAGQGAVASRLATYGTYVGYEPDSISWQVAEGRLTGFESARVVNAPVPENGRHAVFDLLVALEVLEHLEDDRGAMMSWSSWVRPGGSVIVSVPAHPHRFGPADIVAGHFRRYDRARLSSVLVEAGLEVEQIECYGFPLGRVTEWVRTKLAGDAANEPIEERTRRSGRLYQPGPWVGSLVQILVWPFRLAQRCFLRTDLGVGYVAIARKAP